MEVRPTTR